MRKWLIVLAIIAVILVALGVIFHFMTHIAPPEIADKNSLSLKVEQPDTGLYRIGNNWLRKSSSGLWEMYLEGKPYERGVINGKLCKDLIFHQEDAFVNEIGKMIPSSFYQRFLKYFIFWFNRNIDDYITEEYKQEIFGISHSTSDKFSFIGPGYQRMLDYHSAHDIGHALQDMRLVGCTSFGVWSDMSETGDLLVGRNFDFYSGDEFAENKIVCFEKPDNGYAFMMITWGGMIGTVSGMNEKGITVTINADKSEIPYSARTPVSLVAREILQYASSIEEAFTIASSRKTFVSESFLIGSGKENQAAIIEKTPFRTVLLRSPSHYIICTNHFRSPELTNDPLNRKDMKENASVYRYKRVLQDLTDAGPMTVTKMAEILRDRHGLNGSDIGMGNEKAINQLIAHHSVIFEPGRLRAWVSTSPWQEGTYVCYDLFQIIHTFAGLQKNREITSRELDIPADPFMQTGGFSQFLRYRELRNKIHDLVKTGSRIAPGTVDSRSLTGANPEFYESWELAGDLLRLEGKPDSAVYYYRTALAKEIPRKSDCDRIIHKLVQSCK